MTQEETLNKILEILKEEHLSMSEIQELLHAIRRKAEDLSRL